MTGLRLAAIAIAILAVADPGVTSSRSSRPLVSVVTTSPGNAALGDAVVAELGRRFTAVRGPIDGAAGTVLVGRRLPDEGSAWRGPVVAIKPASAERPIRIVAIDVPDGSPVNVRVPVIVRAQVNAVRGRRVQFQLRADGAVVETQDTALLVDSAEVNIAFTYLPVAPGMVRLETLIGIDGSAPVDSASTVTEIRDQRFDVLFFDLQASWASTFVRRAVEADPRFTVTHRVRTSRGVSSTSGSAPANLRDAASLADVSTIVVGSPDQLTEADAGTLSAFMRGRGGRVVLLMDGRIASAFTRLTGVERWRSTRLAAATALADSSRHGALRAQELAWPAQAPVGWTVHSANVAADSSLRAVVWSIPVGAGRLLVSGALDAWHYRDADASAFDTFWPNVIAELGAGAPPRLEVSLSSRALTSGQVARVSVQVRDVALSRGSEPSAEASATLVSGTDSTPVRLWPTGDPGVFTGTMVAPGRSGTHRLIVAAGVDRSELPFMVDPRAVGTADDTTLVDAFVSSRGGFTVSEADVRQLSGRLASAFPAVSRVETWYPMRSAWWIVPFTLLLGAEWWWRRRRGLA